MRWFETVRDHEVEIFADSFDGDPSVGIEYGPEEVWAVTMAGASFDLTDEEVEKFTIEAAKRYHEDDDYGLDEL